MKPVILLAVFLGSALGAGLTFVVLEHVLEDADEVAAHAVADTSLDEIARLREENAALASRIARLETRPVTQPDARAETPTPAPSEDLLARAREAAREEARAAVAEAAKEAGALPVDPTARRAALAQQLITDLASTDENVRRDAVRNLRMLKSVEAREKILAALSDPVAAVRQQAALYFEEIWHPDALEPLAKLMHGEDIVVGEAALDALNTSGDERAIKELENYYLRGPDMYMAWEAGKALEENNRKDLIPPGVQRFRDNLTNLEAKQRRWCVRALRSWGSTSDIPAVRALKDAPDLNVRREVQQALRDWNAE